MTTSAQREHYAKELIVEHVVAQARLSAPLNHGMLRELGNVVLAAREEQALEELVERECLIDTTISPTIVIDPKEPPWPSTTT